MYIISVKQSDIRKAFQFKQEAQAKAQVRKTCGVVEMGYGPVLFSPLFLSRRSEPKNKVIVRILLIFNRLFPALDQIFPLFEFKVI